MPINGAIAFSPIQSNDFTAVYSSYPFAFNQSSKSERSLKLKFNKITACLPTLGQRLRLDLEKWETQSVHHLEILWHRKTYDLRYKG
jgi:hypothetical protein